MLPPPTLAYEMWLGSYSCKFSLVYSSIAVHLRLPMRRVCILLRWHDEISCLLCILFALNKHRTLKEAMFSTFVEIIRCCSSSVSRAYGSGSSGHFRLGCDS